MMEKRNKERDREGRGSKERHGKMKLNDEMKRAALRANKENSWTFLREFDPVCWHVLFQ